MGLRGQGEHARVTDAVSMVSEDDDKHVVDGRWLVPPFPPTLLPKLGCGGLDGRVDTLVPLG